MVPELQAHPRKIMILNKTQRENATALFSKDPFAKLQGKLLNATVRINNEPAWGSGVIFFVTATDAYVLTAKHVLHTLLKKTPKQLATPENAKVSLLKMKPKLYYGPAKLLELPKSSAFLVDIDFTGYPDSAQTWTYDACVLRLTDGTFLEHARKFALIDSRNLKDYMVGLKASGTGMPFLSTKTYQFAQLGYGDSLDGEIKVTENYPSTRRKCSSKKRVPMSPYP
jgi:hypothetical protein